MAWMILTNHSAIYCSVTWAEAKNRVREKMQRIQTTSRTERIKIIVKAAEKYLGIKGMVWETVRDNLSTDTQSTQHNAGID